MDKSINTDTEGTTSPPDKKRGKGELFYLLLILLLLCSNGAIGWMWWKDKGSMKIITIEKETVTKDAEIVKQELIALNAQYENLKVSNQTLQTEINNKRDQIATLQMELEKNKDNVYIIAKLKKETQTLRTIMQHFVVQIDSLGKQNKVILADREKVKGELIVEKEINTQLVKEKAELQNTVNIASMLKAVGLSAAGVYEKRGGRKEATTRKAKHTDKIRIFFTIAENLVTKKGKHTIYARIISPDGTELCQSDDSEHTFQFGQSHGFWATKKTIDYANENTNVVMYALEKKGDSFIHGKYIIEVAADGATIGNTTLELE